MNEFTIRNIGDLVKLVTGKYLPENSIETILGDKKVLISPIDPYNFIFPISIVVENGNLRYNLVCES